MRATLPIPAWGGRPPSAHGPLPNRLAPLLLLLAAAGIGACSETHAGTEEAGDPRNGGTGTSYGRQATLGEGVARTYVTLEHDVPVELGVAISEDAFRGLRGAGAMHPHTNDEFLLSLPEAAGGLPFTFVELNWNPTGHEPEEIYGLPHFDVHFYTISREARTAIDPADPRYAEKAGRFPSFEYVPSGYIPESTAMGGVDPALAAAPRMGMHWVHEASPELNGATFTHTLIYGTWDGELTFVEPMVSKAFLDSRPDARVPMPMAQRYRTPGYYPREYRVYWEPSRKEYRVALSGFELRG
jgi:hypothetical protein